VEGYTYRYGEAQGKTAVYRGTCICNVL